MSGKRENVSNIPKSSTLKFQSVKQVDTLHELMARMSQLAQERGEETLEEADDFDVGDDFDPTSPWEEQFSPSGESLGFMVTGLKKSSSDAQTSAPQEQVEANEEPKNLE